MAPLDSFELKGTNRRIPSQGLGTFQVDPKVYPEGSVKNSVLHALSIGCRHIDAALAYGWGSVERDIGAAIKESGVSRDELFVVTKLHNCFHDPDDVPVGMDMSLANLGLDYVDLYLMHFPYAYVKTENYGTKRKEDGKPVIDIALSKDYISTWAAMEQLVDQNKTKLIGVSNFSSPKLKRLLKSCRIHPVVNQVELNPYFPQKGLVRFCQQNQIHVTAYGPLGCTPVPYLIGRRGPGPLEDATVKKLAEKYSRTPAQIILCHMIALGVSVIPKSNSVTRISENYDCLFDLEDADSEVLSNLMGVDGKHGVRNLETREYLGFDNFNEEVEEP
ncbi:Aldo/keto reductase [Aulographum hederae CBS 113979]|uniref:Aldo/keto reductase n=1 Tax=Aulographum hederae CBS 113979 TaxID=1176131 RepID=A0A6G1GN76_9PEZI|nr:Aldo/keto reductase [Aulographum hederae CBS 113979]